MINQKSFNYHFNNTFSENNYFVNSSNFNAFSGVIKNDFKNLFLYGPNKSGKSFLGQIWMKKNNAIRLNNDLKIILDTKLNVLVDDLMTHNQEEIFYLVNNCILNNLKILIISNTKINDISFRYEDLSSRLKTFNSYEIEKPDDEMLITILTKLLIEKQFIINSNEIFDYILRRVDRSYQAIYEIVTKLDEISLDKKRQLTIPLIKEIL